MLAPPTSTKTLEAFRELGYLTPGDINEIEAIFGTDFPFADAMALAESVHVNVKVDEASDVPRAQIEALGATVENEKDGYVKYAFAGGLNMIFASRAISQDDLAESADTQRKRPFIDHIGIDIREDSDRSRRVFDTIVPRADQMRWDHISQGGDRPVFCLHVEVAAKHWLFPPDQPGRPGIPFEFAIGPLKVHSEAQGCDLRPAKPTGEAASAPCCGESPAESAGKAR
ncbi:MAG: hypothetical protein MJE77_26560 [Proteobacteria bacterium]|nr:hypothetical protein [Pseudomonadota bacterium]